MKKEPERKIPYGIYRKGFFILVAGAESEGMAAKVAAIREHLERVGPIRAGVYRMLAVSGPDDAAGEPFLRVSGRHFKNGLAGCIPRSPRMPVILEGTRILGQAGGHKQAAAAWAWTSGLAMSVALAGNASRRNAIPICRVQSPLLPVFQDCRFSKSNHASGREPCISIIRPGDCAAGPITATS